MNKLSRGIYMIVLTAAVCATSLLLAEVGYRFYLSASDGFRPYLNHVASFGENYLFMKVGAVSFFLLNVLPFRNRPLRKVSIVSLIAFVLTTLTFFLMRHFNLLCTYEDFVVHGV